MECGPAAEASSPGGCELHDPIPLGGRREPSRVAQNAPVDAPLAWPATLAELGEPLALGRTAEVFALGDAEVVKVLRPGFPDRIGELEARVASVVATAGVAAPRFLGMARIEGRVALGYERLSGSSMLDRMSRRPWQIDGLARQMAGLHTAMHATDGNGLPDQRDGLRVMIERAGTTLPQDARLAALGRLDSLAAGGSTCHGDMHPGNILLTHHGPVVIDWLTGSCGSPACDVARTLFLMRHSGVPAYIRQPQRGLIALARRRFCTVYLEQYARVSPFDGHEVAAWRLPVLAARLGEGIETERTALLQLIGDELELA